MGQYYIVVNPSKKQFLDPHKFGDGLKLLEFGMSGWGTMAALAVLLADGSGRSNGGDLRSSHPIVGSWAGDSIVIAGDYADRGKFVPDRDWVEWKNRYLEQYPRGPGNEPPTLYVVAREIYRDVSAEVLVAVSDLDGFVHAPPREWIVVASEDEHGEERLHNVRKEELRNLRMSEF